MTISKHFEVLSGMLRFGNIHPRTFGVNAQTQPSSGRRVTAGTRFLVAQVNRPRVAERVCKEARRCAKQLDRNVPLSSLAVRLEA